MQAMLLAAGHGTRLRPLTERCPKPIVPVGNRPLAWYALQHLAGSGFRHVVANTHVHADAVEACLATCAPEGLGLGFSRENTLLGTGGGIRAASGSFEHRDGPVVVMNADLLFAPDLSAALARHVERNAVATMILRDAPENSDLDVVGVDAEGFVSDLVGVQTDRTSQRRAMFTGVHVLSPAAIDDLPDAGCVIRNGYTRWIREGRVAVLYDPSPWADLGTIAKYFEANLELTRDSSRWPADWAVKEPLAEEIRVPPKAVVTDTLVGSGAKIQNGVQLDQCVVWPNTRVTTSHRRSIVTPHAIVRV